MVQNINQTPYFFFNLDSIRLLQTPARTSHIRFLRLRVIKNMETEIPKNQYKKPPKNFRETIKYLGPGLIIAAAIVGAGELIATTKTGADAGFSLLWLIIIGCLIKVFVQIELGRFTIISGKKTIEALNEIPGPRKRVNWIVWYWLVMFVVAIAQLGGVIGGVGQSLAIMFPLTEAGAEFNTFQEKQIRKDVDEALKNQKQESSIPEKNKKNELSSLTPVILSAAS